MRPQAIHSKLLLGLGVFLLSLVVQQGQAEAQDTASTSAVIYDAATDFDASLAPPGAGGANPNGVWTYGETAGLFGVLVPFPDLAEPAVGVNCSVENMWLDLDTHIGFTPSVAKSSAACFDGNVAFDANQLILHGGPPDRYAHVVFAAPSDLECTVAATFIARQHGVFADVHVLLEGAAIFSDVLAGGPGTLKAHNAVVTLVVGDTVSFAVGLGEPPQFLHPGNVELRAVLDCDAAAPTQGARIALTKTVGLDPDVCSETNALTVPARTPVYYCYTVQNTGSLTLTRHSLVDSYLGSRAFERELPPGRTFNTVELGLTFSATPNITTTNTATWIARPFGYAVATASAQATVFVTPTTPVSITVTTTEDELNTDGDCSLREAIRAANLNTAVDACPAGQGADTVILSAGSYRLALEGPNEDAGLTGDLDITNHLTIGGAGSNATLLDGACLDRIFEIMAAATVTVMDVGMQGGCAESGAGLVNRGSLTLSNSTVNDNQAFPSSEEFPGDGTGGIDNTGLLTLLASTVAGNSSDLGASAIRNSSVLTMTDSIVEQNMSLSGYQAAVTFGNSGTALLLRSTVRGNERGIWNDGQLMLVDSNVSNNGRGEGRSGGIGNGEGGLLTVRNSAITGNRGIDGGGIYNQGTATVINTTVSGNLAVPFVTLSTASASSVQCCGFGGNGGGIANLGGTLTLTNSTISQNQTLVPDPPNIEAGEGGGIYNSSIVNATNTVIVGNVDAGGETTDCFGALISQGYNLIGDTTGCTIAGDTTGNLTGVDPLLDPLQDNGGSTLTHALLTGSPAIDAGNPAMPGSGGNACAATDQRGVTRPQDGNGDGTARCDMGAYEREPGTVDDPTGGQGQEDEEQGHHLHLPFLNRQ
jgi:CSLREA domain-containing protein